jgi:hypothetical protein
LVFNLDFLPIIPLFINIIVAIIVLSPALWLSGRGLVGKEKAKFTDAISIIAIGVIVGSIFGVLFSGWLTFIIEAIIWLALVKHFFDCGWLKALAISLLALILFGILAAILIILGFSLFAFL